jgi:hypothetical protein
MPALSTRQDMELDVIPPSSMARVPLSAVRSAHAGIPAERSFCEATPVKARAGNIPTPAILATPRPALETSDSYFSSNFGAGGLQNRGEIFATPSKSRQSSRDQMPNMPAPSAHSIGCTPQRPIAVQATPTNNGTDLGALEDDPIYKALGWDDFDELA